MNQRKPEVDETPLAVTSNGTVLLNAIELEGRDSLLKLVMRASAMERPVFVGVALTSEEVERVRDRAAPALEEGAAVVIASWLRR